MKKAKVILSAKKYSTMTALFLAVLLASCIPGKQATQNEPLEILFVGNSFTFFNNMPMIFAELAESSGHRVEVTSVARAGFSLEQHAVDKASLDMLENKDWDYVVLQERSEIPAIVGKRDISMYPVLRLLNEKVHIKGGEVVLFMTWGNQNGLPEAGFHNYKAVQSEIASAYLEIANELGVRVAPVGIAWQKVLEQDPQLNLWGMDGSHPSHLGSFLAANVLYATIFNESPVGIEYSDEEDVGEAARTILQGVAADVVLGDTDRWNIP